MNGFFTAYCPATTCACKGVSFSFTNFPRILNRCENSKTLSSRRSPCSSNSSNIQGNYRLPEVSGKWNTIPSPSSVFPFPRYSLENISIHLVLVNFPSGALPWNMYVFDVRIISEIYLAASSASGRHRADVFVYASLWLRRSDEWVPLHGTCSVK